MNARQFPIVCVSNAHTSHFPNNSLVNFTNIYENVFLSGGDWQVSLHSLFFDATFLHGQPTIIKVLLNEISAHPASRGNKQTLAIIPFGQGTQTAFHFEARQKEYYNLKQCARVDRLKIELVDENNLPLYLAPGQATFVRLLFTKMSAPQFVIRVSSIDSVESFPANAPNNFQVHLHSHLSGVDRSNWHVALSSIHFPPIDRAGYGDETPHIIMLYADMVSPIIIGSRRAPVLKMIPVSSPNMISYESPNLDFANINSNNLSVLRFELRDSAGQYINFTHGTTRINLIFKHKYEE